MVVMPDRRAELWSTPLTRALNIAGPAALPNIAEDTSAPMDIESPTRPTGKSLSRNGMSFRATTTMATSPPIAASPVSSLMTAMEAKYGNLSGYQMHDTFGSARQPLRIPTTDPC